MDLLQLRVHRHGQGATVRAVGELDRSCAGRLLECALGTLHDHGPHLAIDLSGIGFMDSGGVEVLLTIRRRARLMGGQLWIVWPSRPVRRVLGILGVDVETVSAGRRAR